MSKKQFIQKLHIEQMLDDLDPFDEVVLNE